MGQKRFSAQALKFTIKIIITNDYLKKAGLCSLRDGRIAVHYPNQKV